MVETLVETLSAFLNGIVAFLPPGLFPTFATAFIEGGAYLGSFRSEFVGTLLMIGCTFSAGKWIGAESPNVAWISHFLGVIAADFIGGGPHVNPAVTVSMWCLGKCTYTDGYVRIAAQMAGGLVAFPLFHAVSDAMKLTPFGGPEFNAPDDAEHVAAAEAEAFLSEYSATVFLLFAIYLLNWELNFGKHHYIIKQSLTAVAIRVLIELFPTAGPAMNPMLATAWDVFGVGTTYEFPSNFSHYFVYWLAPFLAAITASIMYVAYAGGTVFGSTVPIGPIKKEKKKKE